jgi:Vinculin family
MALRYEYWPPFCISIEWLRGRLFFQAADLVPHVVKAARIVLMNPDNQASVEHFELLKKQWMENAEKLRGLVDEAVDTAAFICANGMLVVNCQKLISDQLFQVSLIITDKFLLLNYL